MDEEVYARTVVSDDEVADYYSRNLVDAGRRGVDAYRAIIRKELGYAKSQDRLQEALTRLRRDATIVVDGEVLRREVGCDLGPSAP